MCSTSVHFRVNVLPHSPHEKGFSPVWNRSWFCRIVIQCFFAGLVFCSQDKLLKTKYRVTIQVVSNLPLTSKQRLCCASY